MISMTKLLPMRYVLLLSFTLMPQQHFPISKYKGNFISETSEMKLQIHLKDSVLFAQASGNPPFQIYPKGQHEFFGKKIEITFKFRIKSDTVFGITAERMGQKYEFKKLD